MLNLFIGKGMDLEKGEVAVMAALNGLYSPKHEKLGTSVPNIGLFMTGRMLNISFGSDRTIIETIRKVLKTLSQKGYIEIIQHAGDVYELSNKGLMVNPETETFTMIEHWEMQKIFQEAKRPFELFRFYVNIIGTINNDTKEWHMSQDKMAELFGGSKTTISKNLERLEEMELLYIYRPKRRRTDGTFHRVNNSYGRYRDKEKVVAAAKRYLNTVETQYISETVDRRAIKLRYNAYRDGSRKYEGNMELVEELYAQCQLYNKSLEYKPIEVIADEVTLRGLLDLSIFPEEVRGELTEDELF